MSTISQQTLKSEFVLNWADASQVRPGADRVFSFGPWRLIPSRRLLLNGETTVRVGSRALEVLIALVERPGELVSKKELMSRVWPDTHVVEGNLKFQIAGLRRVLGDGRNGCRYLESSPGQGYRFVEVVEIGTCATASVAQSMTSAHLHNLPSRTAPLIGRSSLVAKIADGLQAHRLVTLVGPPGMGKSSVGLAVAERMISRFADGVWLADLGQLAHLAPLWITLAARIGSGATETSDLVSVVTSLRDKRMLLVFDNCGHLASDLAAPVAEILKAAPGLAILATSRELLRVEGEQVYHLGPLDSPPPSARLSAAEALRFPAIQLFVERAAASIGEFELQDEHAAVVSEICRELDGIPLAIELAAARIGVLGLRGLRARLEDRLYVLTNGYRTARACHRTMRAALDWSYELLTASERKLLARLAAFSDRFTLAAAISVAGDETYSGDKIVELVLELTEKSLLCADVEHGEPRFRLLNTIRAYALDKLAESGEGEMIAKRHAAYHGYSCEACARNPARSANVVSAGMHKPDPPAAWCLPAALARQQTRTVPRGARVLNAPSGVSSAPSGQTPCRTRRGGGARRRRGPERILTGLRISP